MRGRGPCGGADGGCGSWDPAGERLARAFQSAGRTRPFRGDVRSGPGLASAAAARAYRGEIVLAAVGGSAGALRLALNLFLGLRALGIEHLLLLADSERTCERLADALARDSSSTPSALGCGWWASGLDAGLDESSALEGEEGWERWRVANHSRPLQRLMAARWELVSRLVSPPHRLSVLALDIDVAVASSPYAYLKRPPFSDAALVVQAEVRRGREEGVGGGVWGDDGDSRS